MAPSNFNKLEIPLTGNWFTSFLYYVLQIYQQTLKEKTKQMKEWY
jgi:hypothetical protein